MVKPPLLFVDCWKLREMLTKMGEDAREYVRRNFLITRHLGDYLALMNFWLAKK